MRTIIINNNCPLWLLPLLALCSPGQVFAEVPHYVVHIDKKLQTLQVEGRFSAPQRSISARSRDASRYVSNIVDCETDKPLRTRGRHLVISGDGITCLRYRVDLQKAARADRRNANLSSENVIASPAVWLYRPPDDAGTEVRFEIDPPMQVAVAWQPVNDKPGSYKISDAPGSSTSAAVFGRFTYAETLIPGALLRISIASSSATGNTQELIEWVRTAASHVALAYGEFPNESPSVLLLPTANASSRNSAVRFGRVVRDGGESIELFVNPNVAMDEFYDDWTATHEFSHLLMPYLSPRHRWISEGFAQYYQNVLLSRAGQYSPERAWQEIVEGLDRGRNSSPNLSPNEASSGNWRASTMKVYWSGAALLLLADIELRQRSNGSESLDTVLKKLKACCLPAADMWNGIRLLETLDSFVDEPVFMPLYHEHANAAGFPDTDGALRRLGVIRENGAVRLKDDAELASLRQAITGG
ncbi:MAG: hypothetical protein KJO82_05320 [Gammaproteobacteria bacterium]|nr:hypothetical protein [Gammaproteobacteria bacterium]NNC77180.1 hypothetical protein [Woeseiaceae bacterium]